MFEQDQVFEKVRSGNGILKQETEEMENAMSRNDQVCPVLIPGRPV
jgi:hypothetical protein